MQLSSTEDLQAGFNGDDYPPRAAVEKPRIPGEKQPLVAAVSVSTGVGAPRRSASSRITLAPAEPGLERTTTTSCETYGFAASFFGIKPMAKLTTIAPQKSQNARALGEWKSTL